MESPDHDWQGAGMASALSTSTPVSPFGARLRQWREIRGLSQLGLASQAGSTPRHISFLETGRSRPGRALLLRLADVLQLPLRDRNLLLQAAGLAPEYPEAGLDATELQPFRRILDQLLTAHEPYPGLVLDAHANVVAANRAAAALFGGGLAGVNLIERYLTDASTRDAIVNWPEVAWAALARLRKQLHRSPLDDDLRALVVLAETAVADLPPPREPQQHSLVACPWFRIGDTVIRTIVVAAHFDTAMDVTLDELRIELVYPQDATAERYFREHAQ
jgi:transcriptional regulator with XRE-family HTH domain